VPTVEVKEKKVGAARERVHVAVVVADALLERRCSVSFSIA
jgi:hypothetical protein